MFGRRMVRGPGELGDVQAIFVAIDDQRHFGDVLFVEPEAGNAHASRPATQVPGALGQAGAEDLGLLVGLGGETAEDRAGSRGQGAGSREQHWNPTQVGRIRL